MSGQWYAVADLRPDGLVWGIGESEKAALSDAREWTHDVSGLVTLPCSRALADRVLSEGGGVAFEVGDGQLELADEVQS